jgi:hypothetical protein
MDTLPPVPSPTSGGTLPPLSSITTPSTTIMVTTMPAVVTTMPATMSTERVELSTVEKMVIGVAIAVAIILLGLLVSVATR